MSAQGLCPHSSVWQVVHPLISLLGGIFVWIGVWDYIVDYLHGNTAAWEALYMLVGLAFLFATRTLIAQAGLKPAAYIPTSPSTSAFAPLIDFLSNSQPTPALTSSSSSSTIPLYLRSFLALLAGITFWLGAYNLFDLHLIAFGPPLRDVAYAAVGLVLMLLTANVVSEGQLSVDSTADPSLTSSSSALLKSSTLISTTRAFVLYHVKALVGLYGDVLYWVGAYNLADTHAWQASPTRDALYVVGGFAVFFLISLWTWKERLEGKAGRRVSVEDRGSDWTPLPASNGQEGQQTAEMGWGERAAFYGRVLVAMVAGILVWVGWWNILSTWVVTDSSAVADAEIPGAEESEADASHPSHSAFHTLSLAPPHPVSPLPHLWAVLQRSSTTGSSFPMWVLYGLYAFTGLVLLVVTNTFTSQAGVIQPLGLIRQQANVGINAEGPQGEGERGEEGAPGREHPDASADATGALSNAVPSL